MVNWLSPTKQDYPIQKAAPVISAFLVTENERPSLNATRNTADLGLSFVSVPRRLINEVHYELLVIENIDLYKDMNQPQAN